MKFKFKFKILVMVVSFQVTFIALMLWAGFIMDILAVGVMNNPLPGNAPWPVETFMLTTFTLLSVLCWWYFHALEEK